MITVEFDRLDRPVQLRCWRDAVHIPELEKRVFGSSIDLMNGRADARTVEHYSLQWSATIGFQQFARDNPDAMRVTPGRQLGWSRLFDRIRERARRTITRVYDAGCGFGGIMDELFREPIPKHLLYVGADIHEALGEIALPEGARDDQIFLLRFDISAPLPVKEPFDFVVCRAAIHHTPEPRRSFDSLARSVGPRGCLAITAYAKKGRLRELSDDALRREFSQLSNLEAMAAAREFTALGKALRQVAGNVKIDTDLKWLGIPAGAYDIQQFVYEHILKCWYNAKFGDDLSTVVNFDWYHPSFAYRYDREELRTWFLNAGFNVEREMSTKAQHYVEGIKP